MAVHVTRKDGSVAGFPDEQREHAEKYAADVNGEVSDVNENERADEPEQSTD